MDDGRMRELLGSAKTIAVVGMSDKPDRDSNEVGRFLMTKGYRVVPVNPAVKEVLGQKAYASLKDIPSDLHVDIVDVFRKSEAVPGVVEEALTLSPPPRAVWLQLGVRDDASGEKVCQKGIEFYQDLCIMVQHRRLFRP